MFGAVTRLLLCGGMALSVLAVQAADFSVGRVDVVFAEEGWKEVPLPDTSSAYGGDKSGALTVESKLYVRGGAAGDDQVLVLVSATSGGLGGAYMSYSPNCESDATNYREGNSGIRRQFAQCLTVTPMYISDSVFKALAPAVLDMQSAGTLSSGQGVYTVWSRHAISTGAVLDVRVFVMSPIAGADGLEVETLPKGVQPAHVVWGRRLKEAVKSSVYSLSGRLEVPELRLAPLDRSISRSGG